MKRFILSTALISLCLVVAGCGGNPNVYGSISVSKGFGSYSGSGMRGSVTVGGRIR